MKFWVGTLVRLQFWWIYSARFSSWQESTAAWLKIKVQLRHLISWRSLHANTYMNDNWIQAQLRNCFPTSHPQIHRVTVIIWIFRLIWAINCSRLIIAFPEISVQLLTTWQCLARCQNRSWILKVPNDYSTVVSWANLRRQLKVSLERHKTELNCCNMIYYYSRIIIWHKSQYSDNRSIAICLLSRRPMQNELPAMAITMVLGTWTYLTISIHHHYLGWWIDQSWSPLPLFADKWWFLPIPVPSIWARAISGRKKDDWKLWRIIKQNAVLILMGSLMNSSVLVLLLLDLMRYK